MKRVWMLIPIFLFLLTAVSAADFSEITNAVPREAREVLDAAGNDADLTGNVRNILASALQKCRGEWSAAAKSAGMLCALGALCTLASSAFANRQQTVTSLCSAAAVLGICGGSVRSMASLARSVIEDLAAFESVLLPVMATAAASSGAPSGAAALYTASAAVGTVLTRLLTAYVLPMIDCCMVLSLMQTAMPSGTIGSVGAMLEDGIRHALRLTAFAFTAYLSLTGVLRGSADILAVKGVKLASSAAVPLVGSMLADASETVLAAAKVTLHTVGGFGLAAVLAVLIVPLLRIGIQRLLLWLAGAVCRMLGAAQVGAQTDAVGRAMTLYAAVSGIVGLHAFVSAVCLLRVCVR